MGRRCLIARYEYLAKLSWGILKTCVMLHNLRTAFGVPQIGLELEVDGNETMP